MEPEPFDPIESDDHPPVATDNDVEEHDQEDQQAGADSKSMEGIETEHVLAPFVPELPAPNAESSKPDLASAAESEAMKKTARHLPNPYFGVNPLPEEMGPSQEILLHARESLVGLALKVREAFDPLDHSAPYDVYHGNAGIALLFLKIFIYDPGFTVNGVSALTLAQEYIEAALAKVHAECLEEQHHGYKTFKCGFIGSRAGVYAVAAAVYHQLGSQEQVQISLTHLTDLKTTCLSSRSSRELFYGKPGYLYALLFVRKTVGITRAEECGVSESLLDAVMEGVIADGRSASKRTFSSRFERQRIRDRMRMNTPMAWDWHLEVYLGAAHGTAGALATLLMMPKLIEGAPGTETATSEPTKMEVETRKEAHEESAKMDVDTVDTKNELNEDAVKMEVRAVEDKKEGDTTSIKIGVEVIPEESISKLESEPKEDRPVKALSSELKKRILVSDSDVPVWRELHATLGFVMSKKVINQNYAVRVNETLGNSSQLYEGDELMQFCHGAP
ncbi:Glutathione S-transferase lancl1, partial [Dinochytrium kinnereticum]